MRGQKVFNTLIKDIGLQAPARKGRNDALVSKRNECLLARYYYYGYYKNKCYEDIIRQLVTEFYLSPATIMAIIQSKTDQVQAIKQRCPVLYYFQNHWPHLKWS